MNDISNESMHQALYNFKGFFPKEIIVHSRHKTKTYVIEKTTTLELSIYDDGTYGRITCCNCNSSLYTQHINYCPMCGAKIIKTVGSIV